MIKVEWLQFAVPCDLDYNRQTNHSVNHLNTVNKCQTQSAASYSTRCSLEQDEVTTVTPWTSILSTQGYPYYNSHCY